MTAAPRPSPDTIATPARGRRRALLLAVQVAAGVALVLGLAVWLVPGDSLPALGAALAGAEPLPLLAALMLYPLVTFSRALRLQAALTILAPAASPVGRLRLTRVAALHSVLSSFAPMRLGELSLVWLLHRAAGTPLAAGSALLLVLRLIDLVVVVGAGMLALAALPLARAALPWALPAAGAVLGVLILGLLLAPPVARALRTVTVGEGDPTAGGRLTRLWRTLLEALAAQTPRRLVTLTAWSLPIWALIFAMAWLCANATEAWIGPAGGVAGGSATSLAIVLPVNTFANAGTFEAAWVLALVPAGLDRTAALATGLLYHVTGLLGSALLGALAFTGEGRRLLIGRAPPR